MSTVQRRPPARPAVPTLEAGQRLDQAEFMRRYELTPPGFTAELIGGIVHVPSPVRSEHGVSSFDVIGWLAPYRDRTPGVQGLGETTTLLDEIGVPQPDAQLRILPEYGGQTRDQGGYVSRAPELVVEVARSSRKIDLGPKRDDYERAGVKEYIVVTINPDEVHWFYRRGKKLVTMRRDRDGLYRSKVFPGLWLDPEACFASTTARCAQPWSVAWPRPSMPSSSPGWPPRRREPSRASENRGSVTNDRGGHSMTDDVAETVNLRQKLAQFHDQWSPKIVGALNGQHIKLVKFQGEFVWHHHDDEDELFLVVKGRFRMEFRDRQVWVEEGELLIVPRGVEHRPVAEEEAHVLLFEPASTLNTGNLRNERTISQPERI